MHHNKGDDIEAVHCLRKLLAHSPNGAPLAHYHLGISLINLEDYRAARQQFDTLLTKYPEIAVGMVGRARLAEATSNWQEALVWWNTCTTRFSVQAKPFWQKQKGLMLMRLGRLDDSQNTFARLDREFPGNPLGRLGLALVTFEKEQWKESLSHWESCFEQFSQYATDWWHNQLDRTRIAAGTLDIDESVARGKKTSAIAKAQYSVIEEEYDGFPKSPPALNFRSILIVTYGRSGSTLVQGMLNTVDGLLIRGENMNIFSEFFKIYQTLTKLKLHHPATVLPEQPWYGIGGLHIEKLITHFRDTARTIVFGDRINDNSITCYGFKEIRYVANRSNLADYLNFLAQLFPQSAFIFNTRNLDDVSKSAWWNKHDPADVRLEVEELEAEFETYVANRSNCFRITYEDLTGKTQKLRDLFAFLGAAYHPGLVDGVLATPHSCDPTRPEVCKLYN